jgi:predicted RNA-binding protein with PUA-like domain
MAHNQINYWLIKSEPFKWSWDQQVKKGVEHWDGVRNYQASNNMKAMKIGDQAFFYHSNEGLEIVGIVEVVKEYYPDHTDEKGRFGMVDFKAVKPVPKPVSLKTIKATPELASMALIKQSRLSVSPVRPEEWAFICDMGGV